MIDAYIFGGYNGEDIFGDLWRLDLDTLSWKKLPNDMAEPAYFHGSAITPVSSSTYFIQHLQQMIEVEKGMPLSNNSKINNCFCQILNPARPTILIRWSNKYWFK